MRFFASTLIACAVLTSAFIYTVDPSHHWHRLAIPNRAIGPGQVWLWPSDNIDEARVRTRQIQWADEIPDVVLMGNSSVLTANAQMLNPRLKTWNLGINSAVPEDGYALWLLLKQNRKIPRFVVFVEFPSQMVEGVSPASSFLSQFRPQKTQASSAMRRSKLDFSAWRDSSSRPASRLSALLSWSMLRSATGELGERVFLPRALNGMVDEDAKPASRVGYRTDGSVSFPAKSMMPPSRDAIRSIATTADFNLDSKTLDRARLGTMAEWMADMQNAGTRFLFIVPPFQNDFAMRVLGSPLDQLGHDLHQELDRWHDHFPNFAFCDARDPTALGCGPTEFRDNYHALPSCEQKELRYCFAYEPQWSRLLASGSGSDLH